METKSAESASEDQYQGNIEGLVAGGCDFIVTVGFALATATRDEAKIDTDVNFALIDSTVSNDDFSPLVLDNVKPVLFDTAQAAAWLATWPRAPARPGSSAPTAACRSRPSPCSWTASRSA